MSRAWIAVIAAGWLINGCAVPPASQANTPTPQHPNTSSATRLKTTGVAAKIVEGAKQQLQHPAVYNASYYSMSYPGGDVPSDRGACTDVVVRALRQAGYDLQKLIRDDMKGHFSDYPRHGAKPDTNIDHRRVPNQRYFFSRFGKSLGVDKDWQPGDIVTWKLDSGLDHTGVLTDSVNGRGLPLVIHNLSQTAEEDVLTAWKITGHYRYPKR
jgi:uncharacterized protein YijF (DUF1287 family)